MEGRGVVEWSVVYGSRVFSKLAASAATAATAAAAATDCGPTDRITGRHQGGNCFYEEKKGGSRAAALRVGLRHNLRAPPPSSSSPPPLLYRASRRHDLCFAVMAGRSSDAASNAAGRYNLRPRGRRDLQQGGLRGADALADSPLLGRLLVGEWSDVFDYEVLPLLDPTTRALLGRVGQACRDAVLRSPKLQL